ncbi:MAG TPA: hypothetical protein VHJ20_22390 [Polyangia bacterium]|nr:hypothetical protein [Polyangia bacterium]
MTPSDPPAMSPALRALIDADLERPGADDGVRAGVYAAIGVSLGIAPVAAVAAAEAVAAGTSGGAAAGGAAVKGAASAVSIFGRLALLAKAPLASVSVGVVIGAAVTAVVAHKPRPAAETAPPAHAAVVAPKAAPAPAPSLAPAVVEAPPVVEAPRTIAASPDLVQRRPSPLAARAAADRPMRASVATTSALSAEQALLDPARGALARHDGAAALALLDQHAHRFPDGALAQEREAMTIHALVLTGDRDRARARAQAFRARYPGSLFGPMIDASLGATLR